MNGIYGGRRINNSFLVFPLFQQTSKRFLKVIYLDESIEIDRDFVNKIIVVGTGGNSLFSRKILSEKVGKLLRSYDSVLSHEKKRDYEKLCSIMY